MLRQRKHQVVVYLQNVLIKLT